MSQYGEELNMQILQPLDLDSTAGILQLNGYLVPLSEWSKAREGYKSNTDRRAFVIILCALIGLAVACMENMGHQQLSYSTSHLYPRSCFSDELRM